MPKMCIRDRDYTSPNPEKSFGLLDEETNCYIELPMEWEGNLKLTDSEQYDGAVELRTVDEDELVMTCLLYTWMFSAPPSTFTLRSSMMSRA